MRGNLSQLGLGLGLGLGADPLLRLWLLRVPPLRRVTFSKRRKSNQKGCTLTYGPRCGSGSFAPGSIRGHRLRFASLHLLSMCLASPNGRCAPTPGSIPPLSLPTGPAIKSGTRANAHRFEWGEQGVFGFGFVVGLPLTPALSPRRGSRFLCFSKSEFNAVSHVGVSLPNTPISSLSLRAVRRFGRARVRGLLIWPLLWLWLWL